ncbi:MAG: glutamate-5-semialdehyde dehydrogenase [Clostridia bacterium]|nr:glutamate-5-semialdehyde dehydrogenase [Clostridia bacterium]
MTLNEIGIKAKSASRILATISSADKNKALTYIADDLEKYADKILEANAIDLANAEANGMKASMVDRLRLTKERISGVAEGVRQVRDLPDPVGEVLGAVKRPNGLQIAKRRVPLGVIGIIYESRPNVTADTAVLCLKSSNACILRGGKEAINSNSAIADIMIDAVKRAGLPDGTVELIRDTSRETASEMMKLNEYIDVLIPRGGAGLINAVVNTATVPVIQTGVGNCHIYADKDCNPKMAVDILVNAKTSRPSVCNAAETLLIHKDVADEFYALASEALKEKNVEIRGCERTLEKIPNAVPATEEDYATEFGDLILAVKVVDSTDEAIAHITKYGTGHSECIVTENYTTANEFLDKVDAAAVYVNASTRFTDGFEFGFGAEIGISTQKMHARGPMGLAELTSVKYIVTGNGQVR